VGKGSLGFGIVRSVESSHGRARLAELCSLLSDELGTLCIPNHPSSYSELAAQCERGELALAWVPPIATARLQAMGKVSVLALPVRRGAVCYRSALIARPDGPTSLAALHGASVGWVDRESCSGYVMPRLFLATSSLDMKHLFARETFLGSHSAVVDAVLQKRVHVGATYCAVESQVEVRPSAAPPPFVGYALDRPQDRPHIPSVGRPPSLPPAVWSAPDGRTNLPVRVLAASAPIPNDALVVSVDLAIDMRSKLLRWFLDLRDERAKKLCLDLFGAGGFRVAAPEHFGALQQMMRAARAHGEMT
jgi:phosphate/phosphite/phosphonate ABC transporter binding protein